MDIETHAVRTKRGFLHLRFFCFRRIIDLQVGIVIQ